MRPTADHPGPAGTNDVAHNEAEPDSLAIPDFARAWELLPQVVPSSVRRPSTPPDPHSYHEAIEPGAIFQLEERQKDGSEQTIWVTPFACSRCRSELRQACSRARPACVRCRKSGITNCKMVQEGYQRLPLPKSVKPRKEKDASVGGTRVRNDPLPFSSATPRLDVDSMKDRLRVKRVAAGSASSSQNPGPSFIPSSSKRSLSPDSDLSPPRKKKTQADAIPRKKRKSRCDKATASKYVPSDSSEAAVVDLLLSGVSTVASCLEWTFVKKSKSRRRDEAPYEHSNTVPSNIRIPRIWTNSLTGLLMVAPELAKAASGFSWIHSGIPILLLGSHDDQGGWINPTTLTIDLSWSLTCHEFELEPIEEANQDVLHPPENGLFRETRTMDSRHSHSLLTTETHSADTIVSASLSTSTTQILPMDSTLHQDTCHSRSREKSPVHDTTVWNAGSDDSLILLYPSSPLTPIEDSPPSCDIPLIDNTGTPTSSRYRIPLNKPLEVEILLNSHICSIPILLWMARDSRLVPSNIPPEYAYPCMGFFFVSDLRHVVVQQDISPTTGLVQGQVCWTVTLRWAPGGEDALFDSNPPSSDMMMDSAPAENARDLLHPWWFDPLDTLSQVENTISLHPRDLRTQLLSFIPLDLISDFHPGEVFPRGWFCKSCGMINVQKYFRHQICQSSVCGSAREKHVSPGKVDPLSSFRSIYQTSILVRPASRIPSTVVSRCVNWDDGMQTWAHGVKDGTFLHHIFTGNQERLQEDATTLLERIQCEVLLCQENSSSPYFIHTTKVFHPSDGSETMVPAGTPSCVRTAYYTLCDFVLRYGEMENPRFGEVRMQSWVNTGSRKANLLLRASQRPVVVHCLGADVVLNFTPKGGYGYLTESTVPDKGKQRAQDAEMTGLPPTEPRAGPPRHLEPDPSGDDASYGEAKEPPTGAPRVDRATAAMDTVPQCSTADADSGAALPELNAPHLDLGMEVEQHELVEPKPKRKKNKVTKEKTKPSIPEISMTLVHGDCVVLYGDDFEWQIVRTGTTILVMGFPEGT